MLLERGEPVVSIHHMAKVATAKELAKRFTGKHRARMLRDALLAQPLFQGTHGVAQKMASVAKIESYPKGKILIKQGAANSDLFHFDWLSNH